MPCIGEEEKGRSSPYQNLGNICCSYTRRVLRFIREQKRPETYIDVSLIWMAECFRGNPVTYNRVLGMAQEKPRGISSLESMMCLCLPHLGWPCQTDTHVVLGISLYVEWFTQISHRDIQIHDHKFLYRSVGHVRRQTRI